MSLNAKDLFLSGGFIMWPLLVLSVISLTIIAERIVFYSRGKYRVGSSLNRIREAADGKGGPLPKSNPLTHFAGIAIPNAKGSVTHFDNVAEREASRLLYLHERGLRMLALIGAISPLIGLLGTVWGMVLAFAQISSLGAKVTPADFADGISTGLMTTVAGLLVAIPAIACARLFEAKVDKLTTDLNEVASHLKEWFFPNEGPSSTSG